MKTAFVSGGSGFIGRNLIPYLIEHGWAVRALARSAAAQAAVAGLGATPVAGDLAAELRLDAALRGCDAVFHAGAWVAVWGDDRAAYEINVRGTERLLAAARAAGVPRFVHVGTEAVLVGVRAPKIIDADETWPLPKHPLGPYSRTKGIAETRVLAANAPGFATVSVRPRFVWGRGDTTLLPELVKAARSGALAWIGGGGYLSSSCHVGNVCEGLLKAAERGTPGGIYFVTDGAPIPFRELVSGLLETQGVAVPTKSIPRSVAHVFAIVSDFAWKLLPLRGQPPLPHAAFHLIGEQVTVSDARARRELGYVGEVSRAAGLAELRGAG
ncbi:MAG: NAD-dependent epimerase/dehydratase family protein [Nevskia sp.]